jgi:ABC-type lipoprotein release transport system permease subunit
MTMRHFLETYAVLVGIAIGLAVFAFALAWVTGMQAQMLN